MTAIAETTAATTAQTTQLIPLEQLHESPMNRRTHYDPAALQQLADNLQAVGQITHIVVRPRPNGKGGYEIAAGHRRLRAAKLAGLPALHAVVRDLDDATFVEILNIENLQRDDLNALEEADGFAILMSVAAYDVPKIAARVGRSIKYVYDRLKLRQLVPEAKKLLLNGTISPGHGILLARLTKEDQKRALAYDGTKDGVFEPEHVDGAHFPGDTELELDDAKKARSVRELKQWIDRNVRFVPEQLDQADLAFDLPATTELLAAAQASKLKVIKITRQYRVPDAARHETERTYGRDHWKRADGGPELYDHSGMHKAKATPSTTCDHSVVGLIVAGPGRGEAFLVCVNKDKCSVHWPKEVKQRAARAKAREQAGAKTGTSAGASSAPKPAAPDPKVVPGDLRERWEEEELTARLPAIVTGVKAVIGELKISDEICWNLTINDLYLDHWSAVGKDEYGKRGGTNHVDTLVRFVTAHLPGQFQKGSMHPKDGPAARARLAWEIWLARDVGDLDTQVEKAITARWAAHRKAAAKPAVQTAAKTKAKAKKSPAKKATSKKVKR